MGGGFVERLFVSLTSGVGLQPASSLEEADAHWTPLTLHVVRRDAANASTPVLAEREDRSLKLGLSDYAQSVEEELNEPELEDNEVVKVPVSVFDSVL